MWSTKTGPSLPLRTYFAWMSVFTMSPRFLEYLLILYMRSVFTKLLFWLVVFIHLCITVTNVFLPYIVPYIKTTKYGVFLPPQKTIYLFILAFYIGYFVLNNYFGCCFLTYWEHYLAPHLVPTVYRGYLQLQIIDLLGVSVTQHIYHYLPIINMLYVIYKVSVL